MFWVQVQKVEARWWLHRIATFRCKAVNLVNCQIG